MPVSIFFKLLNVSGLVEKQQNTSFIVFTLPDWGSKIIHTRGENTKSLHSRSQHFKIKLELNKVVSSNPVHGEVYSIQHYVSLSVTCDRLVVFSGYSGFLHQ